MTQTTSSKRDQLYGSAKQDLSRLTRMAWILFVLAFLFLIIFPMTAGPGGSGYNWIGGAVILVAAVVAASARFTAGAIVSRLGERDGNR